MSAVSAQELAHRVRDTTGLRLDTKTTMTFLADWERTGVAEQVLPGRWALTERGAAMFSAYVSTLDLIDNR